MGVEGDAPVATKAYPNGKSQQFLGFKGPGLQTPEDREYVFTETPVRLIPDILAAFKRVVCLHVPGTSPVVNPRGRTMTVALTVGSPKLDTEVEGCLNRAAYMLLVNPDTMAWESMKNPARDTSEDPGVCVAKALHARKVHDLLCGDLGPVAREALRAAGIVCHRCDCGMTAAQAVRCLKAGELPEDFWS